MSLVRILRSLGCQARARAIQEFLTILYCCTRESWLVETLYPFFVTSEREVSIDFCVLYTSREHIIEVQESLLRI